MTLPSMLIAEEGVMLHGFKLRCPRCRAAFASSGTNEGTLLCVGCHFPMVFRDGVWHALPIERATYYGQFIKDYEAIRSAEGRGSTDSSYYLALPFATSSDCNAAQWKIRARTFRYITHKLIRPAQQNSLCSLKMLDLGAGNGWLSYRLAQMGMTSVAIDLLTNCTDGLGAAKHYDSHLRHPFLRIQAESDRLPFCDAQFDFVIFNASFHYSEDFGRTLREAFRCLRVGGTIVIADSPWYAKEDSGWQMLAEKRSHFFNRFGTFSDSMKSQEFLTDHRLEELADALGVQWEWHAPFYGLRWLFRPCVAALRGRRKPSKFRIYVATKP
jgi:SAM-dependent methyltransferase